MNHLVPARTLADCEPAWLSRPVSALSLHVSGIYHEYTRDELPVLARQAAEVAARFRDERALHWHGLAVVLAELRDEVETHAWSEDDLLFPVLAAHDHPTILTSSLNCDVLLRLVDSLADEHVRIRRVLARITDHLRDASWAAADEPARVELLRRVRQMRDHLLDMLDLEDRCLLPRAREIAEAGRRPRPYR